MENFSTQERNAIPNLQVRLLVFISFFGWSGAIAQTPPLSIICPADITIDCTQLVVAENEGDIRIEGGCDPAGTFYYYEDVEVVPGCRLKLERFYYTTNRCGEMDTCSFFIVIKDTIPLVMISPPNFTLSSCDASVLPSRTGGLPSFTDNCSTPSISWSDVIQGNPVPCGETYTIERTWSTYDQCLTPVSCIQFIFVPAYNADHLERSGWMNASKETARASRTE